jgi:hypothetical protein
VDYFENEMKGGNIISKYTRYIAETQRYNNAQFLLMTEMYRNCKNTE